MAESYHVSGGCHVTVGGSNLGICEDEIDIEIIPHFVEIPIDTFGGRDGPPGDVQAMPCEIIARGTLVYYDISILKTFIQNSLGGQATWGTNVAAGTLLGANSLLSTVVFPSPIDSLPFTFAKCYLLSPTGSFRMSTKYQRVPLVMRGIPYTGTPTSSAGVATWS